MCWSGCTLSVPSAPPELVAWRKVGSSPYRPECATYLHSVPVTELEYIIGHNPVLKARRVEQLKVVNDHNLTWQEVGVKHNAWLCDAAGVESCPLANKEPTVVHKRWSRD